MSYIGVTLPSEGHISPDSLIGEHNRSQSLTTARQLREVLPVQHWSFINCMEQILPFALEAISPTDATCIATTPKITSPADHFRPKESLSAGLAINLYRRMIVENQSLLVPMMAFAKYSHTATNHEIAKVELNDILADFRFWWKGVEMKHGETIDFQDVLELSLRIFLEGGFQLYSAVSYASNNKDYYRVALLRDDMFIETIIHLDDFILTRRISQREREVQKMC